MANDRALIADLVNAVEELRTHARELGCTCATNEQINARHQRPRIDSHCTGAGLFAKYSGVARRAHRRLSRRFPGETGYRGK